MAIGYLGYCKIDNRSGIAPANLLLCNSTGLNRRIEPILSKAVWGAGWANAASTVAYADSQQPFEGNINFELQYNSTVWDIFARWLTRGASDTAAPNRVTPISLLISPDAYLSYLYQYTTSDIQSGAWCRNARISISPERAITVDCGAVAIKRTETQVVASNYAANLATNLSLPASFTDALMNPSPYNRNPIPGWNVVPSPTWAGMPAWWAPGSVPYGLAMQDLNFSADNHTQVVYALSGQPGPLAVIQGTVEAMGDMTLWRDGAIPDPYAVSGTPFTARNAYLKLQISSAVDAVKFNNIIIREDEYNVTGQDTLVPRKFGFYAIGDGAQLPIVLAAFA